jgi:hypothetical protein
MTLRQGSSEYICFSYHTIYRELHTHNLSSGTGSQAKEWTTYKMDLASLQPKEEFEVVEFW